ncbi:MAG TPA: ABC transporter ATP-binding protein [Burkholderiaceae bacterium]|nr:ABC transporter ATP-binding protein [Burkholderiaceae bacterium]
MSEFAPAVLIETRGVTVRFGGLVAVDNVSLAVRERELVGLIGPNGAGKTTFFHTLSGVVRPSGGRVVVCGDDLTGRAAHVFAHHGIARTFQTPRVFTAMSALDNVRFGLQFAGRRDRAEARHRAFADAESLLHFVGIHEAGVSAGDLPPARQRLLEIAMALGARPRVLLLDEVAAGLTESELAGAVRLIRRVRDELGLAVIWIEHAVRALTGCVERLVVLHQGRVLADGPPAEVTRDAQVVEAYLGSFATAEEASP